MTDDEVTARLKELGIDEVDNLRGTTPVLARDYPNVMRCGHCGGVIAVAVGVTTEGGRIVGPTVLQCLGTCHQRVSPEVLTRTPAWAQPRGVTQRRRKAARRRKGARHD